MTRILNTFMILLALLVVFPACEGKPDENPDPVKLTSLPAELNFEAAAELRDRMIELKKHLREDN